LTHILAENIWADQLLKVERVSAGYGKLQIIEDIGIEARPDRITVIVGPNGSGKSTLLKTIAGLTTIYSGKIGVDGTEISGKPSHEIARLGIAYLPQTDSTFTHLTVAENFKMAGYTVTSEDYEDRLTKSLAIFPKLTNYLDTRVSRLSGGERQMVAMTMALLRKPTVMMFDEPTANLAPIVASQVLSTISFLSRGSGITSLLVEQNAARALRIGDYAYLLASGKVIFNGTTTELLEHKELGKLYLGLNVK